MNTIERLVRQIKFQNSSSEKDFIQYALAECASNNPTTYLEIIKDYPDFVQEHHLYCLDSITDSAFKTPFKNFLNTLDNKQLSSFYHQRKNPLAYEILQKRADVRENVALKILDKIEETLTNFNSMNLQDFKEKILALHNHEDYNRLVKDLNNKGDKRYNIFYEEYLKSRFQQLKKLRAVIYTDKDNIFKVGSLFNEGITPLLLLQKKLFTFLLNSPKDLLQILYKEASENDKKKIMKNISKELLTEYHGYETYLGVPSFEELAHSNQRKIVITMLFIAKENKDKFDFLLSDLTIYGIDKKLVDFINEKSSADSKRVKSMREEVLLMLEKDELDKVISNPQKNNLINKI